MFGNHFKYVLALGFLATFVYTSPAVADSISSGIAYDNQQAAVWDSWFGFGNHATAPIPPQIHQDFGSTSGSADFQRPPQPFGTSTGMRSPFASSTRTMGNGDRRLNPQDVITILYKAGLISSDNLSQARQLFPQPTQAGSSTEGRMIPPTFSGDRGMMGSTTIQGMQMRVRFAPGSGQPPAPGQDNSQQ